MDYSKHLVLYSGGIDSTFFIESEKTAKHLLFFKGRNKEQAKVAITNAELLDRFINVIKRGPSHPPPPDGRKYIYKIHTLHNNYSALTASIIALKYGMKGIVMCLNKDDAKIDTSSILKIIKPVEPGFEILLPLINISAKEIREKQKKSKLKMVSCTNDSNCGYCSKCVGKE
ncbi:MAG: hypothetical protein J0I84_23480 [Terrimonas sp.]|nr:hypothetical protein [Terrimonas sp.]